ncbi:hypothetical protein [Microbacterium sp. NPDC055683]
MRGRRGVGADAERAGREWFDETLRAARDVHTIGERRASEGILLALDRWFIDRGDLRGPSGELALVVESVLADGVLAERRGIRYDRAESVLGNTLGEHLTLTFDDVERLGDAFFAHLARHGR